MRKITASLLITVCYLTTVTMVHSQPQFRVTGANVMPTGSVIAWGELFINNTRYPVVVIVNSSSGSSEAFYLDLNYRAVILNAFEDDSGIITGGFIEKEGHREAFVVKLKNGSVKWAVSFNQDLLFVKTLTKYDDNAYALIGLARGKGDSDIAIVNIDEQAAVESAWKIGNPMYDDFVERAFALRETMQLVGSTWCQNVSYADALLINVMDSSLQSIAIGGPDRDEGLAVITSGGKTFLVGTTFSSLGGLSDAFVAIHDGESLKVITVGSSDYDGFVDICRNSSDLYLIGYMVIEGKIMGLLVHANESRIISGTLIESDGSVVPLSIGLTNNGKLVATLKVSNTLTVMAFNSDLEPLAAFTLGEPNVRIRVLSVDLGKWIYNVSNTWRAQHLTLSPASIKISVSTLDIKAHPLTLASIPLFIEKGQHTENVPVTRLIISAIEDNIPVLVIAVPLLTIVVVIIVSRRSR